MRMLLVVCGFWAVAGVASTVCIEGVPHIRQKADFCGEACVAMVLQKLGYAEADQDWVFDQSGLDPLAGRGCHTRELAVAMRTIGFDPGRVGDWIPVDQAEEQLEQHWQAILGDLRQGIPSIVCMRYDEQPATSEHFRLILGFDSERGEVLYHEPAEADGAYRRLPLETFKALWPLKYKRDRWLLIRLALKPQGLPRRIQPEPGWSAADYAQHVRQLRPRVPEGFTIIIQKPFVVIGDESAERLRQRAERTVGWSVSKLKTAYFPNDPDDIIDIWLFRDKESYETWTWKLFEDKPDTPYGYYSAQHKALIMNIATGGGTLVHEIVHPFMDSNFPACPAWFNEGLASLYEQSSERHGQIVGLTNWRLAGLQSTIRHENLPSFEWLLGSTTNEFYYRHSGINYAQARYLCYYLQEQGKLSQFYHQFVKDAANDGSGLTTLKAVLGRDDLAAFQREWEAWVLTLRFP